MKLSPSIGLCATCKHVHLVKSAKGSYFVMCNLAKTDPRFSKYPVLPVYYCPGYKSADPQVEADRSA
jgi:hypothetical protein